MKKPIAPESKFKALAIALACLEKKAHDVQVLHVATLTSVADYLVISSADSERQVRAIATHVEQSLSAQGVDPLSIEGGLSAQWMLIDYADVVVHIFHKDVRSHYALEKLWSDATRVRIPAQMPASALATTAPARPRPARVRGER
ncbi:MAG: ribosome silencing factor [Nitrospirales bacterium]